MKKVYFTLLFSFCLILMSSCKSQNSSKSNSGNKFKYFEVKKKTTKYNPSKLFSEICFIGASPLSIKKAMYELYGHWDDLYFSDGIDEPNLIWKNIPIGDEKVIIIATGVNEVHSYSSVIIVDKNWNDFIERNDETYKLTVETFSKKINDNNLKNDTFFKYYLKKYNTFRYVGY